MTTLHGFTLLRRQFIPELNTDAHLFRHVKTGAELLSLQNDDENKSFGIAFRTPPTDSTGVAHILEHIVLAGSRKYRVKEPFIELVKGSLKTFLNAMTFPDKTVYPVASQNLQDFYNLIDVYLDAVFYPLLNRHTFQQEGWHYELSDPAQPLIFKGVVFNEMKGAHSDPEDLLDDSGRRALFPDTPYGVDSGGDPRHIPDLTWEQLKDFHRRYYHPSNARIWFYGDDPAEERLRLLNAWLSAFEPLPVDSAVALQSPFAQPLHVQKPYAAGEEGKAYFTLNWALAENADPETTLGLSLLAHMLIGTPAAPLRKALIDSGLGEDTAGRGLEGDLRQMAFSTGLKGIDQANAAAVETLIFDTLRGLAAQGIDPRTVAASMNTVEFRLRERNTGGFPRGIALFFAALTTWLYDRDPLELLAFEAPLEAIKARVAGGERYFEGLIARYFLDNPHRVALLLHPDLTLQAQMAAEEQARLAAARAALSPAALEEVIADTLELHRLQETPDDPAALAAIPRLTLADLDKENKILPITPLAQQGAPLLYHDLFTNGVFYLDVGMDLRQTPQELLPFVPLFARGLLDMGTEHEDFVSLSQRIGMHTGGLGDTSLLSTHRRSRQPVTWLFLRGKAMTPKTPELLAILSDVLLAARFDNRDRFRQIVLEEKASAEASLVPAGHSVVNSRISAHFSLAGWASEQMGGISHLFFLRELLQAIESDWPGVLARLEALRALLVNRERMIFNATLDAENWQQVQPQLQGLIDHLPARAASAAAWSPAPLPAHEGLTLPAQVNYVGKGANLYDLGYELHGSVHVVANFLRTTWLWERVRMQGGAYGGFCLFNQNSGLFSFLSYRDPNLTHTLANYDAAAAFLRQAEISEDELTKNIIGVIGQIDAYMLPDAKGWVSMQRHLLEESDAMRQEMREQVLGTTPDHIRGFADVLDEVAAHGHVVVLGPQAGLERAQTDAALPLTLTRVL